MRSTTFHPGGAVGPGHRAAADLHGAVAGHAGLPDGSNLLNLVRQVSINGILAVGVTFVLLTRRRGPFARLAGGAYGRGRGQLAHPQQYRLACRCCWACWLAPAAAQSTAWSSPRAGWRRSSSLWHDDRCARARAGHQRRPARLESERRVQTRLPAATLAASPSPS